MNKYYKITAASVASVSTVLIVKNYKKEDPLKASWTTNFEPSVKWNHNWDLRDPSSLIKPKSRHFSVQNLNESNKENLNGEKKATDDFELNKHSSKASRHLFLVRHGQYEINAKDGSSQVLTPLGHEQADFTGRRLKEIARKFKFTKIYNSTMIRAIQTADNIAKHLPEDLPRSEDALLCEGAPIPPG